MAFRHCFVILFVLSCLWRGSFGQQASSDLFGGKNIENIHLAVTTNADEMVISWLTKDPSNSTCWYGPNLALSQTGYETSYDGFNAGINHNVILTGLSLDTEYSYRCGDMSYAVSEVYTFKTRRASFDQFTFGVYGDMGVENSPNTVAGIQKSYTPNQWELIWHLGDISYGNDHVNFEGVWNTWFQRLQDPMVSLPYMVSPGNHEKWSRDPVLHSGSRNFTAYECKFRMPGYESGTNTSLFYSFDYGPVHFVSLNTESGYAGYPVDPEPIDPSTQNPQGYNTPHPADDPTQESFFQMNWLAEDLAAAAANRDNVPWIFVGGHRPVYEINDQKDNAPKKTSANLQAWLEPLFIQYEVDIYFSGHVHHYTRNWPTVNNKETQTNYSYPDATTYIIHGCAGNIEGHSGLSKTPPSWYAFGDDENFGYGEVTIFNSTHLQWRAYAADTNEKIDEITLSRRRN